MPHTGTTAPNGDLDPVPGATSTAAAAAASTSAYVRRAEASEIPALAAVYARDPVMNWFGGVRWGRPCNAQFGKGR